MFKKFTAVLLCLVMIACFAGCGQKDVYSSQTENADEQIGEVYYINPLTGVKNLDEQTSKLRPTAIMVNNVSTAQGVQTGVSKADIIYETEVEGGITRLMAVYQDISKVEKIGSVRSARYPYVDLAMGHNAVYVHCGQDPTYCAPHLKDCDDLSIDTNSKGAARIPNGLASEHTLYAYGGKLFENIAGKFETKAKTNSPWANFASEDEKLTLDAGAATAVSVPFPANTTKFTYDSSTALYTRLSKGAVHTDYFTNEVTTVKNIFVLLTSITDYPDGKHRKVALESGDGYYITNGTYQLIKWTKGSDSDSFKFTDTEGKEIKISAGNSWVCIANKATCKPSFE